MKAAVVILNWNTRKYLEDFLPGLIASCRGLDSKVFVADSGSTDGSLDYVRTTEAEALPLGANYGFTGGYNRALTMDAEYYVLINSDIEVPEGWLRPLLEYMDANPDCGICGPRLHAWQDRGRFEYAGAAGGYVDRFGYPYCRGRVLSRTERDEGQYSAGPKDVLWITGACLVVRSSLWRELGGLDDRFFAHMEEIDLCWRAHFLGYRVTVVPSSVVYHIGGGTLAPQSPFKLKLNFRNSLMLLSKNLQPTFEGRGMSPRRAAAKAGRILAFRRLLDFGSMLVYSLTGKREFARAVRDARREFRTMDPRPGTNPALNPVRGYTKHCILPLSVLKGAKVFKYLSDDESSN